MNNRLPDQEARLAIRTRLNINMLVEAGAGSGKTESLSGRMVELIASGKAPVEKIAAVTFTKKAAAELRGRFRQELERQLAAEQAPARRQRLREALSGMERMFAGTIHSFCAKLLRERPVEAGLAPGFREIEQAEDTALRRRCWREFIERQTGSPDLLALREAEIRIPDLYGALARICDYPDVEFPADAAPMPDPGPVWTELDRWWRTLTEWSGEINSGTTCNIQKAMRGFRPRYENADRSRSAVLVRLLATWESGKTVTQKWWNGQGKAAEALVANFRSDVLMPFLRRWREYVYSVAMPLLTAAREYAAAERRHAALLNFTDLLLYASRLVRENAAVRQALQEKYQFLFVDEFQDTDPLQVELLFLLASEPGAGPDWTTAPLRPGALFLVGDPKQSIYRFRRADIEMYQQARRRIEETGGAVERLTACFRSGPSLCNWANGVFEHVFPAQATLQQPAFERLAAAQPDAVPSAGPLGHAIGAEVGQKELPSADAAAIAAYMRAEVDAGRRTWGDFLILTRKKRNRLGVYTSALEAALVPYEVSGAGGLLDSPYARALLDLLYALTHPDDGIALTAVLRGMCFGVRDSELYEYRKSGAALNLSAPIPKGAGGPAASAIRQIQEWRPWARSLPVGAVIERILEQSGLLAKAAAASAGGDEAGKLVYLTDCLRSFAEAGMTLGDAVGAVEDTAEDDEESDAPVLEPGRRDVVRIMNLHKAKGLQGKVVFLADPLAGVAARADFRVTREANCAKGYLAITRPKGEFQSEILAHPPNWAQYEQEELAFADAEEKRLLYVASTRARENLIVSEWLGRPRGQVVQPWADLKKSLLGRPAIAIPALPAMQPPELPDCSQPARDAAAVERAARQAQMEQSSFHTIAISDLAAGGHAQRGEVEGPAGRDWGSLIHALLEHAAIHLDCTREDLDSVARWHIGTAAPLLDLIPQALETIERVRSTEFWETVRTSETRLAEAPLAGPWVSEGPGEGIARGTIDLLLRRAEGWHIIDYKTDLASPEQLAVRYGGQVRCYASLWEQATGEPVVYAGVFSIRELRLTADVRGTGQPA